MNKKLERQANNKVIAGVCSGLGKYFNIDPVFFRVAFIALLFAGGSSLLIYIILVIVVPKERFFVLENNSTTNNNTFETFQQNDLSGNETSDNNSLIIGLVLISGGVLFLLNNLVPFFKIQKLWPAILIILGLGLIMRKKDKSKE